jgi:hypothetical protein
MIYGPGETPLPVGPDNVLLIDRFPEDVFHPSTIASVNGKDLVDEHPDQDVQLNNWKSLTVGVVLNPRRGEGVDDDLIIADFMVKDRDAIAAINDGKREVSAGYDADYIQLTAADGVTPILGRGRQINIRMNHVALVHQGRCGSRCAIGDEKYKSSTGDHAMSWKDKIKAAFGAKDEAALDAALAEAPKEGAVTLTSEQMKTIAQITKDSMKHEKECKCATCIPKTHDSTYDQLAADVATIKDAVINLDKRMTDVEEEKKKEKEDEDEEEEETRDEENRAIEGTLEEEAPPGTGDGIAAKAKDSAYLADSWQEAVSLAEVIAPGIQVPTFDRAADPKPAVKTLCEFRRRVLDSAALSPELHTFMANSSGGKDRSKMTCDSVRTLFRAVGQHQKALNNKQNTRDFVNPMTPTTSGSGLGAVSGISLVDLNKRNAEFYSKQ